MVWIARSGLVFLLFGLAACGGLPSSKARLALVGEKLPPIFGPLSWDLTRAKAKTLFPGKQSRDDIPGYADRERLAVTTVWGLDWRDMEPASVNIFHDGGGRVRQLLIETSERRKACHRFEGKPAPKALKCRTEYGVQVTSVLNRLKTRFSKAYGKPKLLTGIFATIRTTSASGLINGGAGGSICPWRSHAASSAPGR